MNIKSAQSFLISTLLHGIFLSLLLLTWQHKAIFDPDIAISVELVSKDASGLGPELTPQTAQNDTKAPDDSQTIESNQSETIAPREQEAPPPEPVAKPEEPKTALDFAKSLNPFKKTETPIKTNPQQTLQPSPQKAAQTPPTTPKSVPSKPQKNYDLASQFDFAAATNASSGVNSGAQYNPKLSQGGAKQSGKKKGGGSKLTGDLESALRNQVKECWAEPADLSDPQSLLVEVSMELQPNGSLAKPPKLVRPTSKAGSSPSLIVAIDNALRAAKQCAPYVLPKERYDEWASFTFRFDPKLMNK